MILRKFLCGDFEENVGVTSLANFVEGISSRKNILYSGK